MELNVWLTIGTVGLIDIMAAVAGPFVISSDTLVAFLALCGLLAATGYFYRHRREDEQIASLLICTTQILSFAVVSAGLSYIVAAANLPSWDDTLNAWDQSIGLDWMAWLRFMEANPALHLPLRIAYASLIGQPFVFTLILAATHRLLHLRIFVTSTVLAILACVALSMLCPAAGHGPIDGLAKPDGFVPASWTSWPIFNGLRDGTHRLLFTANAEGIVTFPSYHAAAGLLGICAMWPVRHARWISLALNLAMIASTPVDGGHYFVDIFAGLILAALCWMAAAWVIDRQALVPMVAVDPEAPSIVPGLATAAGASHGFETTCSEAPVEVI